MDRTPTPEQSLRLIEDTIHQARRSYQKINFYFLVWGILFACAGVAAYMLQQQDVHYHFLVWPFAGIIGGIISGIKGKRDGERSQVVTLMDKVHQWLWMAYVITLVIMIVALVKLRMDPNPFVLVLTALPTFVSGTLIRFKPLMVGGILFWCIGFVSFFAFREYSALVYSLGILVGYIIPGIMLKRQEDGIRTT